MAQGDVLTRLHVAQPADDRHHVAGDVQPSGLPGAYGEEDVGIALCLQLCHRGGLGVQLYLHAHLLHQSHVLVDGLVADAEGRDHLPDDAAQAVRFFKQRHGDARPAHEVRRGHAGGAAADDGHLPAVRHRRGRRDLGHVGVISLFGRHQLGVSDVHGLVVIIPHTLGHAVVGADGARDERQGVLLGDEPQGGGVRALPAQLDILRNVLVDGAAALAGSGEAVQQGNLFIEFAAGQGLDGLHVILVGPSRQREGLDADHVHAGEGLEVQSVQLVSDLGEPLVAAGLQLGGGHGDGPDTAGEQLVNVEGVGTAGIREAQLPAKLLGHHGGHGGGQGEEGLARHVHLLAGQFPGLHVHREGVGELQAKFQTLPVRQGLEAVEHGHRVGILQVLLEVVIVEGDIVIAHGVQNGPGGLVPQDGGIALDEGVQVLLLQQVAGDPLDLVRRAAVEGGHRHGSGHMGSDRVDIIAFSREELLQNSDALLEDGRLGGVHHAVQEGVDLLTLDACQVIAHGHVEHESVGIAQTIDLCHDLQGAPGFHILLESLLDIQLRGPLAVVALILRQDAGAVDAGGQICAVHLLDGLQLEEPGAGEIAGNDVLGQLGVGAGGGAERSLDGLPEDGELLHAGLVGLVDAEHGAVPAVFGGDPGHQFPKGNGGH